MKKTNKKTNEKKIVTKLLFLLDVSTKDML